MEILNIKKDLMDVPFARRESSGIGVGLYERGISPLLPTADIRGGYILICHSGAADFEYSHTKYRVGSRDVIIVFPGDIYTLSNPTEEFCCSWVSYNPQSLDDTTSHPHFLGILQTIRYTIFRTMMSIQTAWSI